jgi:YHS domain-containing protein
MGELIVVLFRGFLFLFLFLMVRSLARSVFAGFRSAVPGPASKPPTVQAGGELKKDPVCGTYVSPAASIAGKVGGETVYFCSTECRDRYRKG